MRAVNHEDSNWPALDPGEIAAELFRDWGLDQALGFIFCVISRQLPLSQIHCIVRHMSDLSTITMLATVKAGDGAVDYSIPGADVARETTGDPLNDRLVSDFGRDLLLGKGYNPSRSRSMLRIRLFDESEWVCLLGIWAGEANVFRQVHLDNIKTMLKPFGRELHNAFRLNASNFFHLAALKPQKDSILRNCHGLKGVVQKVERIAPLNVSVLLSGETGTGKSLVAETIHNRSTRRNGPFIRVNCGAIPESLIESELFGHEKGAFTGAAIQRKGYFEQAHQGTIFLDEIGELSPLAQAKLLHVLDRHEIVRVGGQERIPLNIRLISATHRDLPAMIAQGSFREDLYFRLCAYEILIPPLRDRQEDTLTLARHFLMSKAAELSQPYFNLSNKDLAQLQHYHWPGNVRELEHVIERALINAQGPFGRENLEFELSQRSHGMRSLPARATTPQEDQSLEGVITEHIRHVMLQTNGQMYGPSGAAAILQIHPLTLKNRCLKAGIPMKRRSGEGG